MKKNSLLFILHSKVLLNTIEYIFIGNEDCDVEIYDSVGKALPELYKEPQIVIYEFNIDATFEENLYEIKKMRSALPDNISMLVFKEEIEELSEKVAATSKSIRILEQDEFFLDNLFSAISEEQTKKTVYYQM